MNRQTYHDSVVIIMWHMLQFNKSPVALNFVISTYVSCRELLDGN